MQLPEILWYLHSTKKTGLVPRHFGYNDGRAGVGNPLGAVIFTNNEPEFDFLLTHLTMRGYNSTDSAHALRGTFSLSYQEAVINIMFGVGENRFISYNIAELAMNLAQPLLIPNGANLSYSVVFNVSHADNIVSAGMAGMYIPKLDV